MTRFVVLVLVVVALITTGCSSLDEAFNEEELESNEVRLPNGDVVVCVHDDGRRIRAIDCNFEGGK